eukprot:scaffold9926_cov117-Isochrysis_galbana.AAC.8
MRTGAARVPAAFPSVPARRAGRAPAYSLLKATVNRPLGTSADVRAPTRIRMVPAASVVKGPLPCNNQLVERIAPQASAHPPKALHM